MGNIKLENGQNQLGKWRKQIWKGGTINLGDNLLRKLANSFCEINVETGKSTFDKSKSTQKCDKLTSEIRKINLKVENGKTQLGKWAFFFGKFTINLKTG